MSGDPKAWLSDFGERVLWTAATGVFVTLSQFGADFAAGKLTRKVVVFHLTSVPLLAFAAAVIASRLHLESEANGIAAIAVFLVGRAGLEQFARAWGSRLLGVPMVSPVPLSTTLDAEPRAMPLAVVATLLHREDPPGSAEPDQDLLNRLK